ncbi:putative non-specific serine/threonine protein kinase [Helianthus annuus]|nr:putative non-specific serine/threonine protein kinase [Helianthus annuus]
MVSAQGEPASIVFQFFGRSPRRFSHEEIEKATTGFSTSNFLAEGGYGKVYRGVLSNGQVIAVKNEHV